MFLNDISQKVGQDGISRGHLCWLHSGTEKGLIIKVHDEHLSKLFLET